MKTVETAAAVARNKNAHACERARVCRTGKSARKNFYCPPPRPTSLSPSQVRRGGAGEGEADHAVGGRGTEDNFLKYGRK